MPAGRMCLFRRLGPACPAAVRQASQQFHPVARNYILLRRSSKRLSRLSEPSALHPPPSFTPAAILRFGKVSLCGAQNGQGTSSSCRSCRRHSCAWRKSPPDPCQLPPATCQPAIVAFPSRPRPWRLLELQATLITHYRGTKDH